MIVGILALVGHICVDLLHGDSLAEAAGHGEATSPPPPAGHHPPAPEPHGDDALHAASCEAMPAKAAATVGASAGYLELEFTVRAYSRPAAVATAVAQRATSPPLFLLHAAFLI